MPTRMPTHCSASCLANKGKGKAIARERSPSTHNFEGPGLPRGFPKGAGQHRPGSGLGHATCEVPGIIRSIERGGREFLYVEQLLLELRFSKKQARVRFEWRQALAVRFTFKQVLGQSAPPEKR